jgi:hypothetical protein
MASFFKDRLFNDLDVMNIEDTYQKIISNLDGAARGLIRFKPEEIEYLTTYLQRDDLLQNIEELEKVLCLLDHSASDHQPWEGALLKLLNQDLTPRLMVFTLNCARKHIIQARFKKGQRLHFDFLQTLKKLLFSSSPEVVEWTLRTIEECGNQGVFFLQDFDKIKPPPWKWFNPHNRAVREIITLLERRWRRFEKP